MRAIIALLIETTNLAPIKAQYMQCLGNLDLFGRSTVCFTHRISLPLVFYWIYDLEDQQKKSKDLKNQTWLYSVPDSKVLSLHQAWVVTNMKYISLDPDLSGHLSIK